MKKKVLVCDNCGAEVDPADGATMRMNYLDARKGSKAADLCGGCAEGLPGAAVSRRGRPRKSA